MAGAPTYDKGLVEVADEGDVYLVLFDVVDLEGYVVLPTELGQSARLTTQLYMMNAEVEINGSAVNSDSSPLWSYFDDAPWLNVRVDLEDRSAFLQPMNVQRVEGQILASPRDWRQTGQDFDIRLIWQTTGRGDLPAFQPTPHDDCLLD